MEKFDQHCIIELMGHIKMAGHVTEPECGGGSLFQVNIPKTTQREPYTQYIGKGAIFRMTPCDEESAKAAAEVFNTPPPIKLWEIRGLPQLSSGSERDGEDDWFFEDDDEPLDVPFVASDDEMPDPPEPDEAEKVADVAPAQSEPEHGLSQDEADKRKAAQWARDLLEHDFVILDSETTGLNKERDDQPVQIAVITNEGEVLLDTLVKATIPSELGAFRVHGIGEEQLKDAPTFAEVRPKLEEAIKGKDLVIYNADYDSAILDNASRVDNPEADWPSTWSSLTMCAMHWYAKFYGEDDWRGGYRWQKLTNAAKQCGVEVKDAHTALGDCLMTLEIIKKMAEYNPA